MATRSARSRQAVARLAWVSPDGLAQAEAAREAFGLGIKQAVEKFLLAGIEAAVAVVPPEGGLAAHGVDHGLVELGGGDQLLQKPDQPVGEIEIAPLAMLQHGVVTLPLAQDLGRKTQGAARQHLTAGTWPGSSCSPSMAAVPRLSRPRGRHRFLGQGCFQGTNPLQQLLTGLVGLIEQGLQALRIPAELGPVGLLPDPGRGHGFRLIASWGEAIRGVVFASRRWARSPRQRAGR